MVQKLKTRLNEKIAVGLTGGFGCGKTTASFFFKERGAYLIDADDIAHEALMPASPVFKRVCSLFPGALEKDGKTLNRKKIAQIIFSDPSMRRKLEDLIHPFVFERITEEAGASDARIVVIEVPLLFETGFDGHCHKTVTVDAPEELVIKRLKEKGFTEREYEARMNVQWSLEEKRKKADLIFDNSGDLDHARREAERIWNELLSMVKGE